MKSSTRAWIALWRRKNITRCMLLVLFYCFVGHVWPLAHVSDLSDAFNWLHRLQRWKLKVVLSFANTNQTSLNMIMHTGCNAYTIANDCIKCIHLIQTTIVDIVDLYIFIYITSRSCVVQCHVQQNVLRVQVHNCMRRCVSSMAWITSAFRIRIFPRSILLAMHLCGNYQQRICRQNAKMAIVLVLCKQRRVIRRWLRAIAH